MQLCFAIKFGPGDAALCPGCSSLRIDVDAFHRRQTDYQTIFHCPPSGYAVATAADSDLQLQFSSEIKGIDDVGGPLASGDKCRMFVDQAVVNLSCILVTLIGWLQKFAS